MITTTKNKISYVSDGIATSYDFNFPVAESSDIQVYIYDLNNNKTQLVYGTDYSVSLNSDDSGGTVTLTNPANKDYTILIYREVPYTQETVYTENSPFPAKSHEKALDKLTLLSQQLQEKFNRTLQYDPADEGQSITLPPMVGGGFLGTTADKKLTWRANVDYSNINLKVNTISDLLNVDLTNWDGVQPFVVLVLGYHAQGDSSGGVFYWDANEDKANHNGGTIIDPDKTFPTDWSDTSQQDSWFNTTNTGSGCWKRVYNDEVNVEWFGAKGDGTTDDTIPIQKVFDIFSSIFFEFEKTYYTTKTITTLNKDLFINGNNAKIYNNIVGIGKIFDFQCDFVDLGNLSSDANKEDTVIQINNSDVAKNDWTMINSTDLWSLNRTYYNKGEAHRILDADATSITLENSLFDSYTATTTKVYKMRNKKIIINDIYLDRGNVNEEGMDITGYSYVELNRVKMFGANEHGVYINRSVNVFVNDCIMKGRFYTGTGTSYGLAIGNSQNVVVRGGYYFGGRHAIAIGGSSSVPNIVNRLFKFSDLTVDSENAYSLNSHENGEFFEYNNIQALNGMTISAANLNITNCQVKLKNQVYCFSHLPPKSHDYINISNCNFYGKNNRNFCITNASGTQENITIDNVSISNCNFYNTDLDGGMAAVMFASLTTYSIYYNYININGCNIISTNPVSNTYAYGIGVGMNGSKILENTVINISHCNIKNFYRGINIGYTTDVQTVHPTIRLSNIRIENSQKNAINIIRGKIYMSNVEIVGGVSGNYYINSYYLNFLKLNNCVFKDTDNHTAKILYIVNGTTEKDYWEISNCYIYGGGLSSIDSSLDTNVNNVIK